MISEMKPKSIAALIVYVLSLVFHSFSSDGMVRTTTLLDRLESTIRTQYQIMKKQKESEAEREKRMKLSEGIFGNGSADIDESKSGKEKRSSKGSKTYILGIHC